MRLGDLDALKEHIKNAFKHNFNGNDALLVNEIYEFIDNAPTVDAPTADAIQYTLGYQDGFLEGKKICERPQGELTELTDEVWKLYKKHQSHLATYVLEFGEELADLLGKYNEGGAE